jgi:acyl-CoA oxidase
LAKWVRLDRDGTYHPAPNPALMYATLIPERLSSVRGKIVPTLTRLPLLTHLIAFSLDMARNTTQALTIASRYGVVRRQGSQNQQIMDYQSHYAKLLPAITFMYMIQASTETLDAHFSVLTGGGSIDDEKVYLDHMSDLHAISACLKGLIGWYCSDILETCRRSCGGHAYSTYNGIGHIMGDWGVFTTGGGDNVVMLQQTGKILQQRLTQQLDHGHFPSLKFKSSAHYITDAASCLATPSWTIDNLEVCLTDFSLVSQALHCILVKRVSTLLILALVALTLFLVYSSTVSDMVPVQKIWFWKTFVWPNFMQQHFYSMITPHGLAMPVLPVWGTSCTD